MKILGIQSFLAILLASIVYSHDLTGQGIMDQEMTIEFEQTSLKKVLSRIEHIAKVKFTYSPSVISENQKVSVHASNQRLSIVLDELLTPVDISYKLIADRISLYKDSDIGPLVKSNKDQSEDLEETLVMVTGRVVDEKSQPVPGVNVIEKNTVNGTTTDADGRFSLNLQDENGTLVFSYIGYIAQEVAMNGRSVIEVALIEDVHNLQEVVVTALGIGKDPKSITYATQSVSAEELTRVKDVSFVNSLAGKVAGAIITKGNFGPGSPTKILMRGDKSFTSNSEPLYVVNGAPMFGGSNLLANINPEDIESIQVLKGASAAALYGSQAANGVILVTTKKGKAGTKVNFSSNYTIETPRDLPELQTTYGQTASNFNDSWGAKITNGSDSHLKEFFKPGLTGINALSLSSGNELAQIYLSFANTKAKGILPENELTRNNYTIRVTTQLLEGRLSLDGSVNYTDQKVFNQNSAGGYSALPGIYSFPTGDDFSKYSGDNFETWDPVRQMYVQNWAYIRNETFPNQNPFWVQKRNQNDALLDHTISSFTAKYELTDWLTIQGRGIYDKIISNTESRIYASTQATVAGPNGGYGIGKSDVKYFYSDLLLMGRKDLGNNFTLNATLGMSDRRTTSSSLNLSSTVATSLTYPNYFSVYALNGLFNKSESLTSTLSQAVFGNATIGFKDKLYLDATARNEWSSTVSQAFFYPSVGVSYVILNSPDSKGRSISYAKVRGSYAEVGTTLPFGIDNLAPPYSLDNSGNINARGALPYFNGTDTTNLKPERTKSWEFGADFRLLSDRLSVNLTFYRATTFDQVFQIQAPAGSGAANFWINGGTIRNQGIEGIVSYYTSIGDVKWTPSLTFSTNQNQIRELSDLLNADYFALGGSYREVSLFLTRPKDGQYGSYGDLFGKIYERDDNGNLVLNSDGLPKVSANFDSYVGNANSTFLAGLNNTFTYKNLSASFLIDGRFGGKVYNRTEQWLDYKGLSKRTGDARDNGGVMVEGNLVDAKAFYLNQTGAGAGGAVTENLYDVTNVRLRELSVGYAFPKFKGVSVNLSLVGRNLLFFYKNAPFDPEISASTSQTQEGIASFTMPSVRSFGLNLNATF